MNTIVGLCGYIIVIVFALYTFFCFSVFIGKSRERAERIYRRQRVCIFLISAIAHAILYLMDYDFRILVLFVLQMVVFFIAGHIYRIIYKGLSQLVLNNMFMLIMIGIFMLERINMEYAMKQAAIVLAGLIMCIFIPVIIKKIPFLPVLGWQYAILGIILLAVVFLFAEEKYGAKNWIVIKNIAFQPSEFVKILFVFFIAAVLTKKHNFKRVAIASALAAAHVLILVMEKDLGGALIYFVTYLIMLTAITGNVLYLIAGLSGGSAAAVIAYKLFTHVRTRVSAWRDPWSIINSGGFQISQSLFAIATGGWFGIGLGRGLPGRIPIVESDFIFSAIAEELGGIFSICILLVYISCFIMFVNISIKIKKPFYKFVALGLGIQFIFQVFLAVGGVTRFIPSTGVTLPLISYGGSSVLSTLMLFSIIQGIYVLNGSKETEDEDEEEKR